VSEARRDHWQDVYRTKAVDSVSWFQPHPEPSLDALDRLGAGLGHAFIDIGGGASTLAATLAEGGCDDVAVLDISEAALAHARQQAGDAGSRIEWIAADITDWRPQRPRGVWHDRAVFHFLTDAADRASYRSALHAGLAPGGLAIIATFAPDGPEKCSGLTVQRYDAPRLAEELGDELTLIEHWRETHTTPWGSEQAFTWAAFRKRTQ